MKKILLSIFIMVLLFGTANAQLIGSGIASPHMGYDSTFYSTFNDEYFNDTNLISSVDMGNGIFAVEQSLYKDSNYGLFVTAIRVANGKITQKGIPFKLSSINIYPEATVIASLSSTLFMVTMFDGSATTYYYTASINATDLSISGNSSTTDTTTNYKAWMYSSLVVLSATKVVHVGIDSETGYHIAAKIINLTGNNITSISGRTRHTGLTSGAGNFYFKAILLASNNIVIRAWNTDNSVQSVEYILTESGGTLAWTFAAQLWAQDTDIQPAKSFGFIGIPNRRTVVSLINRGYGLFGTGEKFSSGYNGDDTSSAKSILNSGTTGGSNVILNPFCIDAVYIDDTYSVFLTNTTYNVNANSPTPANSNVRQPMIGIIGLFDNNNSTGFSLLHLRNLKIDNMSSGINIGNTSGWEYAPYKGSNSANGMIYNSSEGIIYVITYLAPYTGYTGVFPAASGNGSTGTAAVIPIKIIKDISGIRFGTLNLQ